MASSQQPQPPQAQLLPIGIQSQSQPLSPDIVEKLLDATGTNRDLTSLLYSADEIKVKEPVYEVHKRPKLSADGRPVLDPQTQKPVMEEYRQKIGEIERRKFIPFYYPHTPLGNLRMLFEVRSMVATSIGGAVQTTGFNDIELEETAKDVAEGIVNMIVIHHTSYNFELSTSKSIALFKDLSLLISAGLNRSDKARVLNLIGQTHNISFSGGFNPAPKKEGIFAKIRKMATG
jgi:hypothetical protein